MPTNDFYVLDPKENTESLQLLKVNEDPQPLKFIKVSMALLLKVCKSWQRKLCEE